MEDAADDVTLFDALRHDAPPGFPSGELDIRKGELVTGQAYDVRVRLHMPRAPVNLDAGNFMIDLHLLGGPDTTGSASKIARSLKGNDALKTVASARRPAILKYVSPLVERATKIATIVLYAAGWRDDAEWLDVQLFDAVSFTYRADVPLRARVELRSAHRLWVYDCAVDFRARFAGLRWLMYNHRIISFVIFTSLFWVIEMITALVFWFGSSFLFAKAGANELDARGVGRSKRGGQSVTQDEDEELQDEVGAGELVEDGVGAGRVAGAVGVGAVALGARGAGDGASTAGAAGEQLEALGAQWVTVDGAQVIVGATVGGGVVDGLQRVRQVGEARDGDRVGAHVGAGDGGVEGVGRVARDGHDAAGL
ncbi:hypothetical protein FH972_021672 [Carpinus fangiana]|uniref:Seipin n=1 Tax=Carpinus fangiana TaxID=176857 RepID=A0A5N6KQC9_9ROSI|nr:hypothetical protein FH972_021672 [Carpinus fangiana]